MRPIFTREIMVMSRRAPFGVATCTYVGLLVGFVVVWRDGVPVLPGTSVSEQLALVQGVLLIFFLPWIAVRCMAAERGDDFVRLSARSAVQPGRLLLAKMAAAFTALAFVVLSGLPIALLAKQMSAVPISAVMRNEAALLTFSAATCVLSVCWHQACRNRLAGWMAATGSMGVIFLIARQAWPDALGAAAAFASVAIVGAVSCARRAESSLRYLSEEVA
jgi:hypothetical protein